MKKLSNAEAELKKALFIKKACNARVKVLNAICNCMRCFVIFSSRNGTLTVGHNVLTIISTIKLNSFLVSFLMLFHNMSSAYQKHETLIQRGVTCKKIPYYM